ncbi:MAG: recombinase XerD [Candidatus Kaistia colombiensis]|nr:MAG: recombinase XerD [Kaistia sp.]
MPLKMASPMKRQGSSFHQFRKRIPSDVIGKLDGINLQIPLGESFVPKMLSAKTDTIVVSLQTRDPTEAKRRHTVVTAYLDRIWDGIRSGPARLSHKQVVALSGEVYRDLLTTFGDDPISPALWQDVMMDVASAQAGNILYIGSQEERRLVALERRYGYLVDRVLSRHALRIDRDSYERLLLESTRSLTQATFQLLKHAESDFTPDPEANRFPAFAPPDRKAAPPPTPAALPSATLTGLVDAWWIEAKATGRKPSTFESYRNTMLKFVKHLGHDDASRVTPEDVIAFKDARLAEINPRNGKPISPKTVKGSDLAGLNVIFDWAVANRKLVSNPAKTVTLKVGKERKTRPKSFSDVEAATILRHARDHRHGKERPTTFAAKRWVPWLCAYTGARVGEIAQLRKQDVRQVDGRWIIHISPEAGTVKTDEARDVPLHLDLVEQGFIEFVTASRTGPLFLITAQDGDVLGPLQGVKNRLGEFVREVVSDPGVQPNHGWRHRFKSVCRDMGVDPGVRDAIQGHAARTVADEYGEVSIRAKAIAIDKLPRYVLD